MSVFIRKARYGLMLLAAACTCGLLGTSALAGGASPRNAEIETALSRGNWTTACGLAEGILAEEKVDRDALGIFGICAALRNDKPTVDIVLTRLKDVEKSSIYYGPLTR